MNFPAKLFLYFPASLIFLFPLAFVAGPAILEIFSFLIIISVLVLLILEKKKIKYDQKIVKFIFCFYLYIFILSLLKNSFSIVFSDHFFYFRFLLLSLCICYLISIIPKFLNYFSIFFLFIYLLLTFDVFYQFLSGKNLIGLEVTTVNRFSGMFGPELILGSYLSRLFPFVFGLIFISNLKNKKIILVILTLLSLTGVIISGERTALGLLFLSLFFIFFKKDLRKFSIYSIVLIIITVSIFSYFNKSQRYRIFIEPFHQMSMLKPMILKKYSDVSTNYAEENLNQLYIFSQHHHQHYLTALNIFKKNFIFGIGPDNFRNECRNKKYSFGDDPCSTHPHNLALQFLSETGLIGFIFYFVAIYYILRELFKKYNMSHKTLMNDLEYFILIGFFINLWPFFPSGNFFNNWISFIFYCPLGFYLFLKLKKND